jgi:dinuclear metal center YbgI/SA1388 family protein
MKIADLLITLNDLAPLHYAEAWDHVGLLAGDPDEAVSKALLTIDMTQDVVKEAAQYGCQLVIAYHPPIFEGLKRIDAKSPVGHALRRGIAFYSPHTALDAAAGGTNDFLADVAELTSRKALKPLRQPGDLNPSPGAKSAANGLASELGMGRIGPVAPVARSTFIERIKAGLDVPQLLVAGPTTGQVTKVAVAAGAAGDLLKLAIRQGADAVVTGEVRHHDALAAAAAGVTVICARHSCSERRALLPLRERLAARHPAVEFLISQQDADPFNFT